MSTDSTEQLLEYPFRAAGPLEPPKEWEQLREECPVAHIRLPSGDQAVLLTRYGDVRQVLTRFTRDLAHEGGARIATNESGGIFESEAAMTLNQDHQRWRRVLARSFTVKRISAMQPDIEEMANRLVDEMIAQGGPADLLSALGFPLPVWVICKLLGIPDVDREKLAHWSNTMLSLTRYTQQEIDAAQAEFNEYFKLHIAAKRAEPGDDLLGDLIVATDEGQQLSEDELLLIGQGVLVAGHETTSNMIGKMLAMLLADRRQWELLLAEPALVRGAVEEALRLDANAGFGLPRFITEDIEIAGQTLPRGTTVVCSMGAANRDARSFESAETMDLRRSPNAHLTFGAGPHSCVGQALARTELQTVLSVLLRRLPTLELAVPVEQLPLREGLLIGGLERVLVRW